MAWRVAIFCELVVGKAACALLRLLREGTADSFWVVCEACVSAVSGCAVCVSVCVCSGYVNRSENVSVLVLCLLCSLSFGSHMMLLILWFLFVSHPARPSPSLSLSLPLSRWAMWACSTSLWNK